MVLGGALSQARGMTQSYPSDAYRNSDDKRGFLDRLPPRSRRHRLLGGVCGGLAEAWDAPVWGVRAAVLLLALLPGPMWVVYLLAFIAMPAPEDRG
ncbi:PspC domain-containing protein [Actinomyces slackii]|uniref:Phage shock protein C n=2 Tax=Actinomyces slackii TaxID=52774 RepID=A0A448K9G1_9ACTO|nr:phage shock protein C [Actinomyces slackii]